MQPETQTQRLEDEYVDELTGEILEAADNAKIVVEDLPKVCRALRAIKYKRELIADYLANETERLTAYCDQRDKPLADQYSRLSAIAEALLSSSGERRLAYPGLGVVRFVAGRESVDTTVWDELPEPNRIELQNVNQGAFRVKTIIEPDKKEIAKRLKEGATSTVPLDTAFAITVAPDRFEFKED